MARHGAGREGESPARICRFVAIWESQSDAEVVNGFRKAAVGTLPGVTLPAGTYLFRLVDSAGSRHAVHVLSQDAKQAYAMLLAIPAQRVDASSEPEVRFMETAANTPAAIKTWWYPGNRTGWEFIYPREQAMRLAQAATAPVLTTTQSGQTTTDEMKTADLSRVSNTGEQTAVTPQPQPVAITPTGNAQEGEVAASTLTIPESPAPVATSGGSGPTASGSADAVSAGNTARTSLPQTATSQPITLMMGTLALLAGAGLWYGPRLGT